MLWVYLNNQGVAECVVNVGNKIRQGNAFNVFVVLEGQNDTPQTMVWRLVDIGYLKPHAKEFVYVYNDGQTPLEESELTFELGNPSQINSAFKNGTTYKGYKVQIPAQATTFPANGGHVALSFLMADSQNVGSYADTISVFVEASQGVNQTSINADDYATLVDLFKSSYAFNMGAQQSLDFLNPYDEMSMALFFTIDNVPYVAMISVDQDGNASQDVFYFDENDNLKALRRFHDVDDEWDEWEVDMISESFVYDRDIGPINTAIEALTLNKQNKLTWDVFPTQGSSNAISSGAVYDAVHPIATDLHLTQQEVTRLGTAKQDKLTAGSGITISGNVISANVDASLYYTKTEVNTLLGGKQNVLTWDIAPTQNSTNAISSGAVYTAVSSLDTRLDYAEGWIDTLKNSKQDTLTAGAGITINENNVISTSVIGITYTVVTSLPTSGEVGTIYLVSNSGSSPDVYDEYIYVNNGWELIGNTQVDLSNYYTKSETDTAIENAMPATFEKRLLSVTTDLNGDTIEYVMFIESQADLDAFLTEVNNFLQSYGVSVTESTFNTVIAGILSQADAQTKAGFILNLFYGAKNLGWKVQVFDASFNMWFDTLVTVSADNPKLSLGYVDNNGAFVVNSPLMETLDSITLDLLSNS